MNKYLEYNENVRDKIESFPIAYAFSKQQFEEAMAKLGVSFEDDLISIGYGGYIRVNDLEKWNKMVAEIKVEKRKLMDDDDFIYQMFFNAMSSHEYIFTLDDEEILAACDITMDCFSKDSRLQDIFMEAKKYYLAGFDY